MPAEPLRDWGTTIWWAWDARKLELPRELREAEVRDTAEGDIVSWHWADTLRHSKLIHRTHTERLEGGVTTCWTWSGAA